MSVVTLTESFSRLEAAALSDQWTGSDELFDLTESETANSVGALNSLLGERTDDVAASEAEVATLRATTIKTELSKFEADLDARWRGALFSLHPDNPDAFRHSCTSARELLPSLLELVAPDHHVLAADPSCPPPTDPSPVAPGRATACSDRTLTTRSSENSWKTTSTTSGTSSTSSIPELTVTLGGSTWLH